MANIKYMCRSCKKEFDTPKTLYDYVRVGYDDYEDLDVCPYCKSDYFEIISMDGKPVNKKRGVSLC